ncbi:MAG: HTTM domain-containing protein [Limisphaerales bacterium]
MRRLFGIDPRSLAVFRMGMGVLLLVDLAIRATDLGAMYTDDGMFPRTEICHRVTSVWNWSFHFGGGSWGYQAMLFSIAGCLAIALVIGFETRLASIGSWLLLLSLHHRAPPILSGADILLRMLLFWGMFLPLDRRWSFDARRRWRRKRDGSGTSGEATASVASIATAGILLQMPLMYLFSAIYKTNAAWLGGGVIAGALAHDFYVSPLGVWLLKFPTLLKLLTWGTLLLEWIGPILLFSPKHTSRLRLVLVASFAAMHLGIAIFLEVDLFSFVALVGLLLFLPAAFWDHRGLARFSLVTGPAASGADLGRSPLPSKRWPDRARDGVCAGALAYVVALNVAELPARPLAPLAPGSWRFLATGMGFGQKWNMFEVVPSRPGWYVARARLRDGSEVDLLRDGAVVDWAKPAFPAGIYPNFRWRKIFREMAYEDELGYQVFREPIARYLCREWDLRHPEERTVEQFELIYCMSRGSEEGGPSNVQITSRERLVSLDWSDEAEGESPFGGARL